jgi:hypothetical protein
MFHGLFFISPITFKATINTDQVISESLEGPFDIPPDLLTGTTNILNCSTFNYETSSAEFIPTNSYAPFGYWGVRDIVLVTTKCRTCASPQLISLAKTGGITIGCLLGILVVLVLPFILIDWFKKKEVLSKTQHI